MSQNGKGDTYRPTDLKKWDNNYERIFGQKKKDDEKEREKQEQK